MAAELSTLVASFLDTNPQIYAPLFLECVNSKRHLINEVIILASTELCLFFLQDFWKFLTQLLARFVPRVALRISTYRLIKLHYTWFALFILENSRRLDWQGP